MCLMPSFFFVHRRKEMLKKTGKSADPHILTLPGQWLLIHKEISLTFKSQPMCVPAPNSEVVRNWWLQMKQKLSALVSKINMQTPRVRNTTCVESFSIIQITSLKELLSRYNYFGPKHAFPPSGKGGHPRAWM